MIAADTTRNSYRADTTVSCQQYRKVCATVLKSIDLRKQLKKELFDILLDVCEIRIAYEHPEWDSSLTFMNNVHVKTIVDAGLSTLGTYQEIAMFLHEALNVAISSEGLLFYQQLFHDMSLLSSDDIKEYYRGINPTRKQELQRAYGVPLDVYKIQSGLQANMRADEVVEIALNQIARKILDLTSRAHAADSEEVYKAIRSFNVLMDRHTRVVDVARSPRNDDLPDVFKRLTVAPQPVSHGMILLDNPNTSSVNG